MVVCTQHILKGSRNEDRIQTRYMKNHNNNLQNKYACFGLKSKERFVFHLLKYSCNARALFRLGIYGNPPGKSLLDRVQDSEKFEEPLENFVNFCALTNRDSPVCA